MGLEAGFREEIVRFANSSLENGTLKPGDNRIIEVLPEGQGFFVSIETKCPETTKTGLVLVERIPAKDGMICVFMKV